MGRLDGRVALVTAAAGAGIGHAICRVYAEEGASVVITDAHAGRVKDTARRLSEMYGREFPGLELDVTREDRVNAVMDDTISRFGRIDIIVNNAARNLPAKIWEMTTENWRQVMDICLTSQFYLIRAAAPHMMKAGSGCIINISSGQAWMGSKWGDSAYAAAKAGVLGLTRVAATELGPHGIRVNAIAPDLIWNDHLARIYPPEYFEEWKKLSPTGQIGKPEDMARIALFLATDTYITGQVIAGSGGMVMHP